MSNPQVHFLILRFGGVLDKLNFTFADRFFVATLASRFSAQVGPWGQCGSVNWTGATTCVSGHYCSYMSAYYSQCIPGTASQTTTRASTATSTRTSSTAGSTPTSAPATGYVTTSGTEFWLNGKKIYFIGYWLTSSGMEVLCIWGFADYSKIDNTDILTTSTINTRANGLQRLDYIVNAAAVHEICLIIPFVNNWVDYGGMKVYIDAIASGQGHDAFYTNTAIKNAYKNYVKAVVFRYTTSPAIFAWELANEPRCAGALAQSGSCTPARVTAWISEIHLVSDGSEGFFNTAGHSDWFYNGGEGVDFEAVLKLSSIDFATFHLYPSHWSQDYSWGNTFITDHGSAARAIGKPTILEEYGVPRSTVQRSSVISSWHQSVLSTNIAGDLSWHFDAGYNSLVVNYVSQIEAKNN
ncbi:glycoside hydrolase superfamily [Kalaharituber pfeilii]|nr:glycoside hydrolase superfamily [Kalaharituber pfeilii]